MKDTEIEEKLDKQLEDLKQNNPFSYKRFQYQDAKNLQILAKKKMADVLELPDDEMNTSQPTKRIFHSNYLCFLDDLYFFYLNYQGQENEENGTQVGRKIHVSIDDKSLDNLALGSNLVMRVLMDFNVQDFKIIKYSRPPLLNEEEAGKQITIYAEQDAQLHWHEIFSQIEETLFHNGVQSANKPIKNIPLAGHYLSTRNDDDGQGYYLAAKTEWEQACNDYLKENFLPTLKGFSHYLIENRLKGRGDSLEEALIGHVDTENFQKYEMLKDIFNLELNKQKELKPKQNLLMENVNLFVNKKSLPPIQQQRNLEGKAELENLNFLLDLDKKQEKLPPIQRKDKKEGQEPKKRPGTK